MNVVCAKLGHNAKTNEGSRRNKGLKTRRMAFQESEGSHQQFVHRTKHGKVTVKGSPSNEIAPGTLRSIMKQTGLK
jgi:predicted RNA binding protein YcfA (HicA-like mRNA interferase family)